MATYEVALMDLASFLTWLHNAVGSDMSVFKRDLATITSQIRTQSQSSWMARRFNKSEKRAVKTRANEFLSKLGSQGFIAKGGISGHASLSAIEERLNALSSALELNSNQVDTLREASARLAAQITAHQRSDVPTDHSEKHEEVPVPQSASAVPNNLTFISLVGTKKGASAGVTVEASAQAVAPGIGSKVGGSAGAGVQHHRKFTDYRLQHYAMRRKSGRSSITVFTQDTHIAMIQTKLEATARADAVAFGKDLLKKKDSDERYGEIKVPKVINTMTYRSASLTWSPPSPTATSTRSLPGTGYSLGTSMAIENFVELARGNQNVQTLSLLSKTLNVRPENLWDVFKQLDYLGSIDAPGNGGPSAMLIETTFKIPEVNIPIDWVDGEPQVGAAGIGAVIGAHQPTIQAIRIRYRAVDTYAEGSTGTVKLGIPKTEIGLTFDLKSIRDANLSGIVELGTFWVGAWDRHNRSASVPEDLVVPPVIVHQ